ncbi:MAG: DegQ family serine endoprotease [Desulfobacterales bacterium]|nr:DegQ family serine endoprotease [Desulfobacterales bacterium]
MTYTKKHAWWILVLFITGAVIAAGFQPAVAAKNTETRLIPENFSALAKAVTPAVVNIRTEKSVKTGRPMTHQFNQGPLGRDDFFKEYFDRFFGGERPREFKRRGLGSGFIIDAEGYIVTNNHVVADADKIKVVLKDEEEFDAKIIGRDPQTDLALIKITADRKFRSAPIGSSDKLEVGQWVVAIGSPFGLEHTVTAGIVSAKGRVIGSGPYDDFIQTDASINPGNSGGPLLNLEGEVVGINTMIIAHGQGIGFAIPIDMAMNVVAQLKKSGQVTRGWLGVTIQDLKGDLAEYHGVKNKGGALVTDVVSGDPADQAGIKPRDVIIEIDGEKVSTSRDLTTLVAGLGVGDAVDVKVMRKGRMETFKVKIGERPKSLAAAGSAESGDEYGIELAELTPGLARRLNAPEGRGVVVTGVKPDGKGAAAGIRKGDIILEVNHAGVSSVDDFKKIVSDSRKSDSRKSDSISLLVQRMKTGLVVIQLS